MEMSQKSRWRYRPSLNLLDVGGRERERAGGTSRSLERGEEREKGMVAF